MIRSAIQPVVSSCITRMPSQSRRRRYPAGLLSLWNADGPCIGPTILTSVAGNQPNADGNMVPWPVNHPGRGVMVQPAYAQLIKHSEAFDNAAWTKVGVTVTPNSALAPDGTMTADTITFAGTDPNNNRIYQDSAQAAANGSMVSGGVWLWAATERTVRLVIERGGPSDGEAVSCALTATPTLFLLSHSATWSGTTVLRLRVDGPSIAGDIFAWGARLSVSPYHLPYVKTTTGPVSVPSTAATSSNNGLAIQLNAQMTAALSGGAFTAAALCWMGVGPVQYPSLPTSSLLTIKNSNTDLLYYASNAIVRSYDGTGASAAEILSSTWNSGEIHLRGTQTNAAKTQFRVGCRRYTTAMTPIDANIVWGAWKSYDLSMNPSSPLRFGYGLTVPIGFLQTQLWNKSASDAEILTVQDLAFDDTFLNYLNDENYTDGDHYVD